ncbi:MAG: TRAP transporter small permease [Pseudomonadota bacterium]
MHLETVGGRGLRGSLDGLYLASGLLSGLFLAAIALTILAQIIGRFVGFTIDATELAGFCMAASTFLGLAYTLKSGTHVRVSLLIRLAPGPLRFMIELACCVIGVLASAYFTYFAARLVLQSYDFNDISPGLLAVPFWIPQSGMAFGGTLLTIAFVDELILVLRGISPGYQTEEAVLDPVTAPDASPAHDTNPRT